MTEVQMKKYWPFAVYCPTCKTERMCDIVGVETKQEAGQIVLTLECYGPTPAKESDPTDESHQLAYTVARQHWVKFHEPHLDRSHARQSFS
ncbi:MAG: hypothetical protein ABII98_03215 [bacterium]